MIHDPTCECGMPAEMSGPGGVPWCHWDAELSVHFGEADGWTDLHAASSAARRLLWATYMDAMRQLTGATGADTLHLSVLYHYLAAK